MLCQYREKSMIPFYILFLLVSFGSVSAVLCTPALPAIELFFGVSIASTQLVITTYLAGYALGQLPYGPLANRFGRKNTLYIGISLSIFGALLCASSSLFFSFPLLVMARFIQALGACVGIKMSFTMVLDAYDTQKATRLISRFLVAFAIMPGIASAIGGEIVQWLNWESCFVSLALFGCGILFLVRRLPETAGAIDPHALNFSSILTNYREKFTHKRLLLSGFLVGSGTAVVYLFAARSPFIAMELIGMRPDTFGFLNSIPSIGMLIGSFSVPWMMKYLAPLSLLRWGIVSCLFLGVLMLLSFAFFFPAVWSLFILISVLYIADAWVFTIGSSFGLANARNKSNASAVFNFLNIGTAFIVVFLSQWIYPELAIALPIAILFLFGVMALLYLSLKRL